ncbi:hypothetical protein [Uliginosibacterium sp. H1]|uniref:hypothetical protein n=1 Tax=Uliginosibacterium sp. H1 TaxID=3114757 RepID=UPI002E19A609|nr:hypothetical protein [Uliginosibacterium sp. H1]
MITKILCAASLAALTLQASAADVGVSISVGEPGFYGRIDIGDYPRPRVIYAEPVIIQPVPAGVVYRPVYLHVPPGHAKNWRKHCKHYDACGRPVYFVEERWYSDVYVPAYHEKHHGPKGHGKPHPHEKGHGKGEKGKGHKD